MSQVCLILILIFSISTSVWARVKNVEPNLSYQIISTVTDSGRTLFKVIEIDSNLLDDQSRISQRVIFEKLGDAGDGKKILDEATSKKTVHGQVKNLSLHRQSLGDLSKSGNSGLWTPVKDSWTIADERDYSQWFSQNASVDFNRGTSLIADCADVGLLFRWAYAHDKKLPVANTLSATGKLFGHFSSSAAWDHLPTDPDWRKDERFKAAMRYLFDNTFTHTITEDMYPTEINPTYVYPGSIYMTTSGNSGHAQTIFNINRNTVGIESLFGDMPASERIKRSWLQWAKDSSMSGTAKLNQGFRLWRWPYLDKKKWKLKPEAQMPGYSLEQFEKWEEFEDRFTYEDWVLSQLGLLDFDEARLQRLLDGMTDVLGWRVLLTAIGDAICGIQPCGANSIEADGWSTHSRDARLKRDQSTLLNLIQKLGGMSAPVVLNAIQNNHQILKYQLLAGYNLTIEDFIFSPSRIAALVPEANASFQKRWGLYKLTDEKQNFSFLHQQFQIVVTFRHENFYEGVRICKGPCQDQDWVQQLNTEKEDRGLSLLAQNLEIAIKSLRLIGENQFLEQIQSDYRNIPVSGNKPELVQSPQCENPRSCTLHDVLWRTDGLKRIEKWTHDARESLLSRWDL